MPVYCIGRSVRGRPATPGRPETLEETAVEEAEQLRDWLAGVDRMAV